MSKRNGLQPPSVQGKRTKFEGGPRVKSGIFSAGASASGNDYGAPIRLLEKDIVDVGLSHFFEDSDISSITQASKRNKIDESRMLRALRRNANEEALRNAVYTEVVSLSVDDLDFPKISRGRFGVYREQT